MPNFSFLARRTDVLLPVLVFLFSILAFKLALFQQIDSNVFAEAASDRIIAPEQFNGALSILLAKLIAKVLDPRAAMQFLTAGLTALAAYGLAKLFKDAARHALYVVASIGFIFLAAHSPSSMLTIAWFTMVILAFQHHRFEIAGVLIGLGYGVDQFLTLGLGAYLLFRLAVDKQNATKSLLSLIVGLLSWTLLAYMLYGSSGLETAVTSGLQGIFKQVNPIDFGVSVLVAFNILLLLFLRSPGSTNDLKYLGSVLIVLFLFLKASPVYAVLLLIVGVYHLSTSGLLRKIWLLPAYMAINIIGFFLLPSVQPMAATYLPRSPQPDEATSYLNRYFSLWMPSYGSLSEKQAILLEAGRLTVRMSDSAAVVLDPMTDVWFGVNALSAQTGRYEVSSGKFIGPDGREISFAGMIKANELYYLASGLSPELLPGSSTDRSMNLIHIAEPQRKPLFDRYIYSYFSGYH